MIDIYFCVDNDKDIARIMNGETGNANITIYNEQTKSLLRRMCELERKFGVELFKSFRPEIFHFYHPKKCFGPRK